MAKERWEIGKEGVKGAEGSRLERRSRGREGRCRGQGWKEGQEGGRDDVS